MSKYCPDCGAEQDDNMVYCLSCGALLPADAQVQPPVPQPPEPGKNHTTAIVAIIAAAAVIIAGVVLLVVWKPWEKNNGTGTDASAAVSEKASAAQTEAGEKETEAPETEPAADPNEAKNKKIEAYIKKNQYQIDALNQQFEGTGEFSFAAEEGNLVMYSQYLMDIPISTGAIENSINNGNTYKAFYDELVKETGLRDVKLILRYKDVYGNLLLEKVIDADFVPGAEKASETLEDLINSKSFQDSIAAEGSDQLVIKAFLEDGNAVVILYELQDHYDSARIAELKETFSEAFAEGGESAENLRGMFTMLRQAYPLEDPFLRVRITDLSQQIIFETDLRFDD